jgi:two-component sensor histidine kinase
VQSIARQTRRSAEDAASFDDAFSARIDALAQAHDLLTRTAWEGAMLSEVIEQTLAPYMRTAGERERVGIAGPPIHLGPNAAVTLYMAFHELATNAAKYGALSVNGGHVGVTWSVDRSGKETMIDIAWTERDGPEVSVPYRDGFGSRLIKTGIPRELGGVVSMDFGAAGLSCRMRLECSAKITVMN